MERLSTYNSTKKTRSFVMYETIRPDQLELWMDRGEPMMLIDLRNRSSFALCHLQGAVNLPFEEWQQQEKMLPKDEKLVFYCARGGKSMRVCEWLSRQGYHVWDVAGGLSAYRGKYLTGMRNPH